MLNILIIREVQIKSTIRYHFTPIRIAIKKKENNPNNKCCYKCGKIGTYALLVGK